jgi:hypothetical protein
LALVAGEEHQLLAGEQVGQLHRVDLAQAHGRAVDGEVGEHRVADLGGEQRQRPLHALARKHVVGRPARRRGEPVEQVGVDVVADAGRRTRGAAAHLLRTQGDLLRIPLAHGGEPIRQEDHEPAGDPRPGANAERLGERALDVRAAVGVEALHPLPGPGRGSSARALVHPALWACTALLKERRRKRSWPSSVPSSERSAARALRHLLARHRAGHVHDDGVRSRGSETRVELARREGEHRVPRFTRGMVRPPP